MDIRNLMDSSDYAVRLVDRLWYSESACAIMFSTIVNLEEFTRDCTLIISGPKTKISIPVSVCAVMSVCYGFELHMKLPEDIRFGPGQAISFLGINAKSNLFAT